ncbi:MAG: diacylglycerol kinase family protein [Bacteroidales bacterium]|nr:diacylglycerol kinase family protein [Bacteroidales bacterium]
MPINFNKHITQRVKSFSYAFSGLFYVLKTQKNTWIHLIATIFVIFAGFVLKLSLIEWAILSLTIGIVWMSEIFNTSIEVFMDMVSPQEHPLAKIVKDVSAAAVLVTALISVIIGIIIFGPKIGNLFL